MLKYLQRAGVPETLQPSLEPYARDWFERNAGAPYDLMGNVRFVLPWLADSERGWFCSEALAAALKLKEPWRFGPNGLAALLPRLFC